MFIELMVSWTDNLNSDNRLYLGMSVYEILFPDWSLRNLRDFLRVMGHDSEETLLKIHRTVKWYKQEKDIVNIKFKKMA